LAERFARAVGLFVSRAGAAAAIEPTAVALADEDERLTRALIERGALPPMPVERVRTPDAAGRIWAGAAGAAGMRLHFAILSVLAGTLLTAVPYDPKVEAFAEEWGIPVWRGGPLPAPRPPSGFAALAPDFFRRDTDALCRRVLGGV
jgi:hypothetical protein